jgi:DNA polymerase delta subunit 1
VPKELNDQTSDIEFMQIDCDYYTFKENGQDKPVIRMFGVTEQGNSVLAHVHNFTAYFYVHIVEPIDVKPKDIEDFQARLNR